MRIRENLGFVEVKSFCGVIGVFLGLLFVAALVFQLGEIAAAWMVSFIP